MAQITSPMQTLKTHRLLIRQPKASDAEMMQRAMKDSFKTLKRWMPWAQHLASPVETAQYLEHCERLWEMGFQDNVELPLQIFSLDEAHYIGATGMKACIMQIPSFEVGYWINQNFTGQGYITEAVCAVVHYLMRHCKAKRVEINCEGDNLKSKQIPIRLGFEYEGTLKNHRLTADGKKAVPSIIYACTDIKQLPPIEYDLR